MGCFYCDEHHEGREAIMYKVGEMEAGVLYLFKDQAHKGRCALALKNHRKELCECEPEELSAFARAGQLFFLVLAVTGGAILLLSLPQVRTVRLLPLWTGDVVPVLQSGFAAAGVLGWGSCWAFLTEEMPSDGKGSCRRTALGCVILALTQGVILGSLGPALAGRLDSPFLALAKSVGVEGAFQRVESVVAALWVTADVTMAGLLVFALRAMASAAVPRYQEEWVGRGAVVLAAIAALLLPGRQVETLERLALGANLWFGLLLPILLAVWIKLYKRG